VPEDPLVPEVPDVPDVPDEPEVPLEPEGPVAPVAPEDPAAPYTSISIPSFDEFVNVPPPLLYPLHMKVNPVAP